MKNRYRCTASPKNQPQQLNKKNSLRSNSFLFSTLFTASFLNVDALRPSFFFGYVIAPMHHLFPLIFKEKVRERIVPTSTKPSPQHVMLSQPVPTTSGKHLQVHWHLPHSLSSPSTSLYFGEI